MFHHLHFSASYQSAVLRGDAGRWAVILGWLRTLRGRLGSQHTVEGSPIRALLNARFREVSIVDKGAGATAPDNRDNTLSFGARGPPPQVPPQVPLKLRDLRVLDHGRPFLDVGDEACPQLVRRTGLGGNAHLVVALNHIRHRQDLPDRLV